MEDIKKDFSLLEAILPGASEHYILVYEDEKSDVCYVNLHNIYSIEYDEAKEKIGAEPITYLFNTIQLPKGTVKKGKEAYKLLCALATEIKKKKPIPFEFEEVLYMQEDVTGQMEELIFATRKDCITEITTVSLEPEDANPMANQDGRVIFMRTVHSEDGQVIYLSPKYLR